MGANDVWHSKPTEDWAAENGRIQPHPMDVHKVSPASQRYQEPSEFLQPCDSRRKPSAKQMPQLEGTDEARLARKGGIGRDTAVLARQKARGHAERIQRLEHRNDCERGAVVRTNRWRDMKDADPPVRSQLATVFRLGEPIGSRPRSSLAP